MHHFTEARLRQFSPRGTHSTITAFFLPAVFSWSLCVSSLSVILSDFAETRDFFFLAAPSVDCFVTFLLMPFLSLELVLAAENLTHWAPSAISS